jgi:hypothetical protein
MADSVLSSLQSDSGSEYFRQRQQGSDIPAPYLSAEKNSTRNRPYQQRNPVQGQSTFMDWDEKQPITPPPSMGSN